MFFFVLTLIFLKISPENDKNKIGFIQKSNKPNTLVEPITEGSLLFQRDKSRLVTLDVIN